MPDRVMRMAALKAALLRFKQSPRSHDRGDFLWRECSRANRTTAKYVSHAIQDQHFMFDPEILALFLPIRDHQRNHTMWRFRCAGDL